MIKEYMWSVFVYSIALTLTVMSALTLLSCGRETVKAGTRGCLGQDCGTDRVITETPAPIVISIPASTAKPSPCPVVIASPTPSLTPSVTPKPTPKPKPCKVKKPCKAKKKGCKR